MKPPAVAITAAFASGIAMGLHPTIACLRAPRVRYSNGATAASQIQLGNRGGVADLSKGHRRLSFSFGVGKRKLGVTVLDVGRGDSLFIVSPIGKTMLIEAGERSAGFRGENNIVEAIRARKRFRRFCGRGDFKHWMRIPRTDRHGAVHILTHGTRVEISCFVACPDPRSASGSVPAQAPNHEQSDEKQ